MPSDCWYASSVPEKKPWSVAGAPSCSLHLRDASVASLSETSCARLNETVTEGKKPVWLIGERRRVRMGVARRERSGIGAVPPDVLK